MLPRCLPQANSTGANATGNRAENRSIQVNDIWFSWGAEMALGQGGYSTPYQSLRSSSYSAFLISFSLLSSFLPSPNKGKRVKQKHRLIDRRSHTVSTSREGAITFCPCSVSSFTAVEQSGRSLLSLPLSLSDPKAHRTHNNSSLYPSSWFLLCTITTLGWNKSMQEL